MSNWNAYFYAGTATLVNKLNIRDADQLNVIERQLAVERAAEGCPSGDFDLVHLRAIHHHLFQDIYGWAGQLRTVEMVKESTRFSNRQEIETDVASIHDEICKSDYLRGLQRTDFTLQAAIVIGGVNRVHPFREGNGRAQLQYLQQLGERAGWPLDLCAIDASQWIEASRDTSNGLYRAMQRQIDRAVQGGIDRDIIERFASWGADHNRDRDRGGYEW